MDLHHWLLGSSGSATQPGLGAFFLTVISFPACSWLFQFLSTPPLTEPPSLMHCALGSHCFLQFCRFIPGVPAKAALVPLTGAIWYARLAPGRRKGHLSPVPLPTLGHAVGQPRAWHSLLSVLFCVSFCLIAELSLYCLLLNYLQSIFQSYLSKTWKPVRLTSFILLKISCGNIDFTYLNVRANEKRLKALFASNIEIK